MSEVLNKINIGDEVYRLEKRIVKPSFYERLVESIFIFFMGLLLCITILPLYVFHFIFILPFVKIVSLFKKEKEFVPYFKWTPIFERPHFKLFSLELDVEIFNPIYFSNEYSFSKLDEEDNFYTETGMYLKSEPEIKELDDSLFQLSTLIIEGGVLVIRVNKINKGMSLCFISSETNQFEEILLLDSFYWTVSFNDDKDIELCGYQNKCKQVFIFKKE